MRVYGHAEGKEGELYNSCRGLPCVGRSLGLYSVTKV